MAGFRYLVAAALLAPFAVRAARRASRAAVGATPATRWRPSLAQVAGAAAVGVLLLAGGNGGVSWSERSLPSGLAALLVSAVPLWMVVGDRVVARAAPSLAVMAALAAGFAGVAVLGRPGGHHVEASAVVVILLASMSWAVGSLVSARVPQPGAALLATTVQMAAGGVVLVVLALGTGELGAFHLGAVSARSWLALAYLVGPGSIVGLTCYVTALKELPTSVVATYAYVNPVVAVFLGWAVLGEAVTPVTLLGGALVLGAVALIVADRRQRQPASA